MRLAAFWLPLPAMLFGLAGSAFAAAAPRAGEVSSPGIAVSTAISPPAADGPLLLEVFVNHIPTDKIGEFVRRNARVYARAGELRELGLQIPAGAHAREIDLVALSGVHYVLDEAAQRIDFEIEPDRLAGHVIDARGLTPVQLSPAATGLFLNYDAVAQASAHRSSGLALLEIHGFSGLTAASARFFLSADDHGPRIARLDSAITFSTPDQMRRITIGDLVSGALGSTRSVRLGGVQISTAFEMRPDLITFPVPSIRASVAVPSTFDVLVDGNRQLSSTIPAGPFAIEGLPLSSGAGTVSVQMRDALGRPGIMEIRTYTSTTLLAPGLTSYSLEAGAIRGGYGVSSNDYRSLALSGSLRHGFEGWTFEAHGEARSDMIMAAVGVGMTLGRLASLGVGLSASGFAGRAGGAIDVQMERQSRLVRASVRIHYATQSFVDLAAASGDRAPNLLVQASAGAFLGALGSMDLGFIHASSRLPPSGQWAGYEPRLASAGDHDRQSLGTFAYYVSLGREAQLSANAFHDFSRGNSGGTVSLAIALGPRRQVSASAGRTNDTVFGALSARQTAISDGDVAWAVEVDRGLTTHLFGTAQGRSRFGTFGGGIHLLGGRVTAQATASGSIGWTGGSLFAANVIHDSFAVVDLNGQGGVEIRADGRPVGRTDSHGRLILSELSSFSASRVSFDASHLPLNVSFELDEQVVRPGDRNGIAVHFDVRVSTPVIFSLVDDHGAALAVGSAVHLNGSSRSIPVGYDGDVFIAEAALHNDIQVDTLDGGHCRSSFDLPEGSAEIPRIGPLVCHRVDPSIQA